MLKAWFNTVMERRGRQLLEEVGVWLPPMGPILDLGSGTGHLSVQVEQQMGLKVVATDVTDIHVVGHPPVTIADNTLPFATGTFSAALLCFMLSYPSDPSALLREVARVTQGPIIVVQSLYAGRLGYLWLRSRELLWTIVAFHVSKIIGYVPPHATFTMQAQRFYTADRLTSDAAAAGLRIRQQKVWHTFPAHALVVAGWVLERDE